MPLDIGVGILLALLTQAVFDIPLTPVLVLVGVAAALFPDIDIVTALFGRWRHRELTHYSLLYVIPLGVMCAFAPPPYAFLISLGILAHLIHDTIGTGWGISWLWPFSNRRFLLYPDGARRTVMGRCATWLPEEHPEWAHQGRQGWVRELYFRPSMTAVVEYGLCAAALLTLFLYIW